MIKAKSEEVVVTMVEGDYAKGAIVLLNSLIRSGFRGIFVVGYRGQVNNYLQAIVHKNRLGDDGFKIVLEYIETSWHFTSYKPIFMLEIFNRYIPEYLFYFDPDIVVKARWSELLMWANCGVALCEDVNSPIYRDGPKRKIWSEFCFRNGIKYFRRRDEYFNAGFVGLSKNSIELIELWQSVSCHAENENLVAKAGAPLAMADSPNHPFRNYDQDLLNIAIDCWEGIVSPVGKEGMDFIWGGTWMSHAIGAGKPWNRSYWRDALKFKRPRQVDIIFWKNSSEPYAIGGPLWIIFRRFSLVISRIFGRF